MKHIIFILSLFFNYLIAAPKDIDGFIDQFSAEKKEQVRSLLMSYEIKDRIIELINKPAERLTWTSYRDLVIDKNRIEEGKKFMAEHAILLRNLQEQYGVPPRILTALIGLESHYGKRAGSWSVGDALKTLSFSDYRRAEYFQGELKTFLDLVIDGHLPSDQKGSYAGAFGFSQFMPSSYKNYAKSSNQNISANLMSMNDALTSAAYYLSKHGWRSNEPIAQPIQRDILVDFKIASKNNPKPEYSKNLIASVSNDFSVLDLDNEDHWIGYHNFYIITRYNHSTNYAMAIVTLADYFKEIEDEIFN
jgi:membrane-bound lytic murein transglycosylase B